VEKALELLSAPSGDRELGTDPDTGLPVIARTGRFGPYVQLGETDNGSKPRTASLFKSMSLDTIDLPQALQLLRLPREVGTDPESGQKIEALNGRFGPYLKKGTDTRSLEQEEQLFSVTLPEALALFAQPKQRRGRGAAAAPLKELGADPDSGAPVVVRSGRFGPYVTDGTTNASLRRGDDPETITIERAAELLAERRAAGPAKRAGRATNKAAKRTPAKKAAAKKTTAKRAPAKKAAAKKAAAGRAPAAEEASAVDAAAGAADDGSSEGHG